MTAAWLTTALSVVASGCSRDADVTHFRVPKEPPRTQLAAARGGSADLPPGMGGMPPGDGMAMGGAAADLPPAADGGDVRWTLPAGWTESRGGPMRLATLRPPVPGKIDGSVVVLPGPAGGELANVNRWRGQIGLEPVDEAALASARKVIRSKAGPLDVYDFASEARSARLIAALAEIDGKTWFIKLTGDAGAVGAARADFMKLLGSLRRDDAR